MRRNGPAAADPGPASGSERRPDRIALGLVVTSLILRAAQTFPLHVWPADADSLGTGIRALHVLEGGWPVFYNSARLGAAESYLHAVSFSLFGVSREATAAAPLLVAAAFLWVSWLLFRSLFGTTAARAGLAVLAIGSPSFVFWTYLPNGWGLTMLFLALALLAAERIVRQSPSPGWFFVFGLASGLGVWNCLIAVSGILAGGVWILLGRPGLLRQPRLVGAAVLGACLGAAPWLAYNLRHGWPSLTATEQVRGAPIGQAAANLGYLVTHRLTALVATHDPEGLAGEVGALQRAAETIVGAIYVAALLACVAAVRGKWRSPAPRRPGETTAPALLLLLGFVTVVLNVFSEAGQARGVTVRYALPIILLAAGSVGLLYERVQARRRTIAFLMLGGLLAFNFSGTLFPWTRFRQQAKRERAAEDAVLNVLTRQGTEVVWGDYWLVFPLNFVTRERVVGIPVQPNADLFGYSDHLPARPVRWAICGRTRAEVSAWSANTGYEGTVVEAAPERFLFLPRADQAPLANAPELNRTILGAYPSAGS